MNLYQDYILADNTRVIGTKSIADSVTGLFIGTKKYFFFIPVKAVEVEFYGTRQKQTRTAYFFKGKPVNEYLKSFVQTRGLSVQEFERFMLEELRNEIEEMRVIAIEELGQFKVFAKWWSSGIVTNESEKRRVGWKPFVTSFKENKKEVCAFYQGEPKMVG